MTQDQKDWVKRFQEIIRRQDWKVHQNHGIGYLMEHESGMVVDAKAEHIEGELWVSIVYSMKDYAGNPIKLPWEACRGVKQLFFRPGERVQIQSPPRVKKLQNEFAKEYWHRVPKIKRLHLA